MSRLWRGFPVATNRWFGAFFEPFIVPEQLPGRATDPHDRDSLLILVYFQKDGGFPRQESLMNPFDGLLGSRVVAIEQRLTHEVGVSALLIADLGCFVQIPDNVIIIDEHDWAVDTVEYRLVYFQIHLVFLNRTSNYTNDEFV